MNNKNDYLHSAAMLVKSSAKQLCFYKSHERKVTPGMIHGNTYADKISGKYKEMRNQYHFKDDQLNDHVIFFSFDEIVITDEEVHFIEHKQVRDLNNVEPWFLDMSALQLAFFYSLHLLEKKHRYVTAKFAVQNGSQMNAMVLEGPAECEKAILNFGGDKYLIKVINPMSILTYYKKKAISSCNYTSAELWDNDSKKRDYELLYKYFNYIPYEQ